MNLENCREESASKEAAPVDDFVLGGVVRDSNDNNDVSAMERALVSDLLDATIARRDSINEREKYLKASMDSVYTHIQISNGKNYEEHRPRLQSLQAAIDRCQSETKEACAKIKVLRFDLFCLKLRYNKGVESSDLSKLTSWFEQINYINGYAQPLGEALLQGISCGTPVTDIALHIPFLGPPDEDKEIQAAAGSRPNTSHAESLLRFVRTSERLSCVRVCGAPPRITGSSILLSPTQIRHGEQFRVLVEAFLVAIADNPNISLVLYQCRAPAPLFCTFMSKAKSVKCLDLDLDFEFSNFAQEHDTVAEAIRVRSADSLEGLILRGLRRDNPMETQLLTKNLMASILKRLAYQQNNGQSPSMLTLLTLGWNKEIPFPLWQETVAFLHSTSVLRHLDLDNIKFDAEGMSVLLHGMRDAYNSSLSSEGIRKLSLSCCFFTKSATQVLIDFMNEPVSQCDDDAGGGNAKNCHHSLLHHLRFDISHHNINWAFEGGGAGPAIARMLRMQKVVTTGVPAEVVLRPTIGSQIHTLTLIRFGRPFNGCFEALFESPELIRLVRLVLDVVDHDNCVALMQNLSRAPSIQQVYIVSLSQPRAAAPHILNMLRENSNLYSFTCEKDDPFTTAQSRLAQAFQERNRCIRKYINQQPLTDRSNESDDATAVASLKNGIDDAHSPKILDVKLQAPLFQTLARIPINQSKLVLRGLLNLEGDIGTCRGQKRKAAAL